MNLIKSLLGTGTALAFAAAVMLPLASSAQQVKGAQLLLPAASPTSDTVSAPAMACPKCNPGLTSSVDASARGAIKPVVSVAQHSCCDTSVKTVGIGKQAKNVNSHTCAMGSTASCCN